MAIVISQPTRSASERRIHVQTQLAHAAANSVNTPLSSPNDAQLLQRVAAHDRQAFAQLYDRYATVLFSTICRVLGNRDDAADVLQEVFLQVWDKAVGYNPMLGKPFTWLLTIARHKSIDRLRTLRRRYSFIEEASQEMHVAGRPPAAEPGEAFGPEQVALVRSALAELPLEQRQAIEMAFLGGLTQHEIADALQQPLGTIKARIRRGMLKLRDSLKPIL